MKATTLIDVDRRGTGKRNTSQRTQRRRPAHAGMLGGLLILGLAGAGLWHGSAQIAPVVAARVMPSSAASITGPVEASAPSSTPTARKGPGLPGEGDPPIYWDTIKQRVARGLHRSVASLSRLWSAHPAPGQVKGSAGPPPTTIYDIAVQEGLTLRQLRTLELAAIQQACNTLVNRHALTHQQAVHRMAIIRGWPQGNLDGYVMYAFGMH